ncbi:hypothetical protein [Rhodovastum atsumiense]|nr:hypothetical protein [Rhodovastum atsumiense]
MTRHRGPSPTPEAPTTKEHPGIEAALRGLGCTTRDDITFEDG